MMSDPEQRMPMLTNTRALSQPVSQIPPASRTTTAQGSSGGDPSSIKPFSSKRRASTSATTSTRRCSVSKLVRGIMNIVPGHDGQDSPPGFVYHLPEPPRGHSRESMIDMFHALTEWAKENPGPGKRPKFITATAKDDNCANESFNPGSPGSYDALYGNFAIQSDLQTVMARPGSSDQLLGAYDARCSSNYSVLGTSQTSEPVVQEPLIHRAVKEDKEPRLINFTRKEEAINDGTHTTSDQVHPDLALLRPLYAEQFNSAVHSQNDWIYRKEQGSGVPSAQHPVIPDQALLSGLDDARRSRHPKQHIPVHPSSRPPVASNPHSSRYLGVGLRPISTSTSLLDSTNAKNVLPEKLRIACLELDAKAVKRRPVASRQEETMQHNQKGGKKDPLEFIRSLTPNRPVGKALSGEQIAQLRQPDTNMVQNSRQQYQPYHAENPWQYWKARSQHKPEQPKVSRSRTRKSTTVRPDDQDDQADNEFEHMKQPPFTSLAAPEADSFFSLTASRAPNLPYLAASPAFSEDQRLRELQGKPAKNLQKTALVKRKAFNSQTRSDMAKDLPRPAHSVAAKTRLFDSLCPKVAGEPRKDTFDPSSFRKRRERGVDEQRSEVISRDKSDDRPSDIGKSVLPSLQSANHSQASHQSDRKSESRKEKTLSTIHLSNNNRQRIVRQKVQLFEAATHGATLGEADDASKRRRKESFGWPRFIDRQYVDPASEYAEKRKEERKLRRRGVIFDVEVVARAF